MISILKDGTSAEREVSLKTAASIATALRMLGLEFTEIDAADSIWLEEIERQRPEMVLITLPLVEIRPKGAFFDYEAKYMTESGCEEICPALIEKSIMRIIQEQTLAVFRELRCRHYGRADWIICSGVPYFLEMNTLPGMTETSLLPKELIAAGMSYEKFIQELMATSANQNNPDHVW